jgi:hypothetical protein
MADNGYGRLATSSPVTVTPPSATITVNGASPPSTLSVSPGATLNIQLTGTPGNPTDWLALALSASPNTNFLTWAYAGGDLTTTTDPLNAVRTRAGREVAATDPLGRVALRSSCDVPMRDQITFLIGTGADLLNGHQFIDDLRYTCYMPVAIATLRLVLCSQVES